MTLKRKHYVFVGLFVIVAIIVVTLFWVSTFGKNDETVKKEFLTASETVLPISTDKLEYNFGEPIVIKFNNSGSDKTFWYERLGDCAPFTVYHLTKFRNWEAYPPICECRGWNGTSKNIISPNSFTSGNWYPVLSNNCVKTSIGTGLIGLEFTSEGKKFRLPSIDLKDSRLRPLKFPDGNCIDIKSPEWILPGEVIVDFKQSYSESEIEDFLNQFDIIGYAPTVWTTLPSSALVYVENGKEAKWMCEFQKYSDVSKVWFNGWTSTD